MSVYSHILWGDFYLAEYPIGYIIGHQVRQYLRGRSLAQEMETMCAQGDIFPESWMRSVLGEPISVRPLLEDTALALDQLGY